MKYTDYELKILKLVEDLRKQGKTPRGDLREALIEIQLNHAED